MKKLLMIAYHFPPIHGSSGVHRTLGFSRYLPEYGWQPLVLTVTPGAYPRTESAHLEQIPKGMLVERAFALDSARHLALAGRHFNLLALPDRWISWWLSGVVLGLRLVRKHRPDVIWSTYPVPTAHLIALTLHRIARIPWIADFRDPMTETDPLTGLEHPLDPTLRRMYAGIERAVISRCARATVTTPGTARMYRDRYPQNAPEHVALIGNGFDEDDFRDLHRSDRPSDGRPLRLLHSGLLYPEARDPRPFLKALGGLVALGAIPPDSLRVVFRGSGNEELFRSFAKAAGVESIVSFEPAVPYSAALAEMVEADGLLVLQASNCNAQVPAKLYEYLRAQRPILALTDPAGDTADVLRADHAGTIVAIDSEEQIAEALPRFLAAIRNGSAAVASPSSVERHSRRAKTREFAALLDRLVAAP
jgi:hypothetical protein